MAPKKKATKGTAWMDDHDDAHFDGNPAYRKTTARNRKKVSKKHASFKEASTVGSKKRVGGLTKPGISAKKPSKKSTRKRVAGKK